MPAPELTDTKGFRILLEQGACLVVAKPGGLLTQAPPGIDSLEMRVKRFIKRRDNKPGKVYLGVPHRLDRPVSGAMVLAKNVRAARRLSEQFQFRTVEKIYWAAVEGEVTPESGTWRDMLRKVPNVAQAEVVPEDHPEGRTAILHYHVRAQGDGISWLEIRLETGRMHQIRVQASSRGHPVVGDSQYGSSRSFGPSTDEPRERWIALHARALRFRHPMTRQVVSQIAPLPKWWQELGIDDPP